MATSQTNRSNPLAELDAGSVQPSCATSQSATSQSATSQSATSPIARSQSAAAEALRRFFEARNQTRRGVCFLNAGRFDLAAEAFAEAQRLNPNSASAAELLAKSHVGRRDYVRAARALREAVNAGNDADDVTLQIRHAMLLYKGGMINDAIESLRTSIETTPDCAEIHFQLGTILSAIGDYEEAELRFVQATALDKRHADALVSLALCHAAKESPADAFKYLKRAQTLKPHDARIGQLLALSSRACEQSGTIPRLSIDIPQPRISEDDRAVTELADMIAIEPEFAEALVATPGADEDEEILELLLVTLDRAVERRPHAADLCLHRARVLERLDRTGEAIDDLERAVLIEPNYIQALIRLAKLYLKSDRAETAMTRLRCAISAGAEYADVYLLLGNIHRELGRSNEARDAYHHALTINSEFKAAQSALETLPVGT